MEPGLGRRAALSPTTGRETASVAMLPPGVRQGHAQVTRGDCMTESKSVWELRFAYKASPRPPYLTATDYVFYVKRQTQRDQHHRACSNGSDSSASNGIVLSQEDAMVELTNFTELMRRLKEDLRSSYSSFVEEFVSEPNDGVTLLLDLLKTYRRSAPENSRCISTRARQQQAKKAQSEELDCLQCLLYALRCQKSLPKIISHGSGLCTIASGIMSNCSKSRKLALELLAKTCEEHPAGQAMVLEAMSSVRLIFGEPVRFKFLVAMLLGGGKMTAGFEFSVMYFFNILLSNSKSPSEKVRLQSELEEAGLDVVLLEKSLQDKGVPSTDGVWEEIGRWKRNYLDVGTALTEHKRVGSENGKLRTEVELLRRALRKLEEDKVNLMQTERELKEKCEGLKQEVFTLKKVIEEPKTSSKTSDTEDSDQSDAQATDSGRSSFLEYSTETEQPAGEEVIIDIPTIRPPAGFQSDTEELLLEEKRALASLKISSTPVPKAECTLPSSARGDAIKDDIGWNYPALPEPRLMIPRSARTPDEKPRVVGVHRFVDSGNPVLRRRSKSEDRRKLHQQPESTHEIISNGILQDHSSKDVSVCNPGVPQLKPQDPRRLRARTPSDLMVRAKSQEFKKPGVNVSEPQKHGSGDLPQLREGYKGNSKPTQAVARASSACRRAASAEVIEQDGDPSDASSFPAAFAAYKTNFILRGHGNCGLYSGNTANKNGGAKEVPCSSSTSTVPCASDTMSSVVHREIADAVRQIGGWL